MVASEGAKTVEGPFHVVNEGESAREGTAIASSWNPSWERIGSKSEVGKREPWTWSCCCCEYGGGAEESSKDEDHVVAEAKKTSVVQKTKTTDSCRSGIAI